MAVTGGWGKSDGMSQFEIQLMIAATDLAKSVYKQYFSP